MTGVVAIRLAAGVLLGATMMLAAGPAEAKKNGKKNGNGVKCCVVLGVYAPRMTGNPSTAPRFFRAVERQSGGG